MPTVLLGLLRLLVPGGVYWFTITTARASSSPATLDDQIMQAYHRDMDGARSLRPTYRWKAATCFTICKAGAPASAAGSSDWVVSATGTTRAMSYFLRSILNTIQNALRDRQYQVEPADLADWLAERAAWQLAAR